MSNVITLLERDLSGGKLPKGRIDTLADTPGDRLKIGGLRQDTFEYLLQRHGVRFRHIEFWKCPRVENLDALEDLAHIESISWFWNQLSPRLWNLSKNPALRLLHIRDFTKLDTLQDLAVAASLERLGFEGGMWRKAKIDSLDPLANLRTLQALSLSSLQVMDGRIAPLAQLGNLRELDFPAGVFTTAQLAWLRARLGPDVDAPVLAAARRLSQTLPGRDGKQLDVLVNGKRKPFLDSASQADQLVKYETEFTALLERFQRNPDEKEPVG